LGRAPFLSPKRSYNNVKYLGKDKKRFPFLPPKRREDWERSPQLSSLSLLPSILPLLEGGGTKREDWGKKRSFAKILRS